MGSIAEKDGLYGLGYAYAARRLDRARPLIAIGLAGKLLGPAGWVMTVHGGEWPVRTATLIVFNDVIWWVPFGLFLQLCRHRGDGGMAALRNRDHPCRGRSCSVTSRASDVAVDRQPVSRFVILGGRGWFGSAAAELLRRDGGRPLVASRRPGADLVIDAEDPASIRAALRERDVVIDAAGPFQRRPTVLVESCMTLRCDVIDVSDSLDYARRLRALERRIESAGIRVLTSCSSVSAVSAALVRLSGGFGIDVEDARGTRATAGFVHATHSYIVAVAPAIVAASDIAAGRFCASGLIPPDRHVDPGELVGWLEHAGVKAFGLY